MKRLHQDDAGRSHSISTPGIAISPAHSLGGAKRKSLWQSITGANGNGNGPTRRSSEDVDAGSSAVSAAPGSSGWFSNREETSSLYSSGDDGSHPAASASAFTDSEAIRNASMGLAASLSYSSSHSHPNDPLHRGTSRSSAAAAAGTGLPTLVGGLSPDSPTADETAAAAEQSQEDDQGLQTIKESSRSSSVADLLTPRAFPAGGGKPLAGLPDSDSSSLEDDGGTGEPSTSPKHGSLGSSHNLPSGLSLLLSRSSGSGGHLSPGPKTNTPPPPPPPPGGAIARGGATDQLASGASGALGALLSYPSPASEQTKAPGSQTEGAASNRMGLGIVLTLLSFPPARTRRQGFLGHSLPYLPSEQQRHLSFILPFIRRGIRYRPATTVLVVVDTNNDDNDGDRTYPASLPS
ncbi:hypothetical protein QFC19_004974 [Naganishia cerealis]|uniref:Uncharacterized protein n=1 Tax=Naganishia cerealis TaxID=610337 RepID=A0ACC2VTF4_9TREE|nr:hypothetical protein QFC19_004974 [Naganishia cerealis]